MKNPKKSPLDTAIYAVQVRCSDGSEELRVFDKEEEAATFLAYMKKHNIQAVAWQL